MDTKIESEDSKLLDKTVIYLDAQSAEDFKAFCLYKQQFANEAKSWKQVRDFAVNMQFGSFSLTIKDGVPVRIDNPLKVVYLTQIKI